MAKTLSKKHRQILCDQSVTGTAPGPILHDFTALLQYVQKNEILLSKTGLFPMKALYPVNEAMHCPLAIGLARPQLRCLPNIEGLYMVLRATEMVRVEHKGKKRSLRPDEEAITNWETLNEVEQYVHLLRAWLLQADTGLVGRNHSSSGRPLLLDHFQFVNIVPRLRKCASGDLLSHLQYRPGHHNVALAELFGLVAIAHEPARNGQGWAISRIKSTPFGGALCALLKKMMPELAEFFFLTEEEAAFAHWQQCMMPLFPQLKRDLVLPEQEPPNGTYTVTASLGDVWRRLAVPCTCYLAELASAVLHAFEFDQDHLYEFRVEGRFGGNGRISHPEVDEPPYADETSMGDLGLQAGQEFLFRYDFGDEWHFGILV
ncbi:MAG: hypothetical protein HN849_19255, partial [Victivallales bacterium]|nr:hypothetical protein [Victivallales bacterium]